MKHLLITGSIALIFASVSAQDFKKQNTQADLFIKQTMRSLKLPGLAVGIVKNGKILKLSAYGKANLDWQLPVTTHTTFQIASVSKLLATTLAMKSMYTNKIALDDEVSKFIDSVPDSWKGMQVKHLLTHTSGVKMFKQNKSAPIRTVIKALKDSTLAFPFGTNQSYVSGDFTVLQYIFERVYKKPYPEVIKEEITSKMGMNDGAFDRERIVSEWVETDIVSNKATTYYSRNNVITPYKFMYAQYTYAAGGYFASIRDMVNWAINMDTGALFPRNFELNNAYTPYLLNGKPSGFSAIGWSIGTANQTTFGGHSGGPALADVQRFPQSGLTVIVLTNDGEMLPYFANALATFYINNLPFKRTVTKFKRTVALQ